MSIKLNPIKLIKSSITYIKSLGWGEKMEKNFNAYSKIFLGICLLLGAGILFLKPMPNRFIFEKVTERDFTTKYSQDKDTETTYTIKDTATGKIYNYSSIRGMLDYIPFSEDKITVINPLLGNIKKRTLPMNKVSKTAFSEMEKRLEKERNTNQQGE